MCATPGKQNMVLKEITGSCVNLFELTQTISGGISLDTFLRENSVIKKVFPTKMIFFQKKDK